MPNQNKEDININILRKYKWGVKNFRKKYVGEGHKILILEGGICYGGSTISGGKRTLEENEQNA